ncbi:hypothetical protein [Massilia eurypsychrophila]|nr:hypothetical protein [Massilia eurypsychrophila]
MSEKPAIGLKVPFGRLGRMVAPTDSLERGLACGCECPGCSTKLLLIHGKKRLYFAHCNAPATNRCVELSIHSAAIQVLMEANYMPLPLLHVEVAKRATDWTEVQRSHRVREYKIAYFDQCRAEVTYTDGDFGTIRADVVCYTQGQELLVEMWYTHAVDADKIAKIERLGMPAIEIYLGDLDLNNAVAEIEQRVLGSTQYKQWLF